jgi:hypothetical protein
MAKKKSNITHLINTIGEQKEEIERLTKMVEINTQTLLNELKKKENTQGTEDNNFYGDKYKVKLISKTTIDYDAYMLDEKLDKDLTSQFIKKEYVITDFISFQNVLKKYGIKLKDIRKLIFVNKKVDKPKLEILAKQDLIGTKDLKGSYTMTQSEYLRFDKLKE